MADQKLMEYIWKVKKALDTIRETKVDFDEWYETYKMSQEEVERIEKAEKKRREKKWNESFCVSKMLLENPETKTYRHYGISEFDADLFKNIRNRHHWNKPNGGFWASDIEAPRSWKDWCKSECFKLESFGTHIDFKLRADTKVLKIYNKDDFDRAMLNDFIRSCFDENRMLLNSWLSSEAEVIDFERLATQFDAMEVYAGSDGFLYDAFYGWDCDSIVVFNKDKIVVV